MGEPGGKPGPGDLGADVSIQGVDPSQKEDEIDESEIRDVYERLLAIKRGEGENGDNAAKLSKRFKELTGKGWSNKLKIDRLISDLKKEFSSKEKPKKEADNPSDFIDLEKIRENSSLRSKVQSRVKDLLTREGDNTAPETDEFEINEDRLRGILKVILNDEKLLPENASLKFLFGLPSDLNLEDRERGISILWDAYNDEGMARDNEPVNYRTLRDKFDNYEATTKRMQETSEEKAEGSEEPTDKKKKDSEKTTESILEKARDRAKRITDWLRRKYKELGGKNFNPKDEAGEALEEGQEAEETPDKTPDGPVMPEGPKEPENIDQAQGPGEGILPPPDEDKDKHPEKETLKEKVGRVANHAWQVYRRNTNLRIITGVAAAGVASAVPASEVAQIARIAVGAIGGAAAGDALALGKTEGKALANFAGCQKEDGIFDEEKVREKVQEIAASEGGKDKLIEIYAAFSEVTSVKGLKIDIALAKKEREEYQKTIEKQDMFHKTLDKLKDKYHNASNKQKVVLLLATIGIGIGASALVHGGIAGIALGSAFQMGMGAIRTRREQHDEAYANSELAIEVTKWIEGNCDLADGDAAKIREVQDRIKLGRKKYIAGGALILGTIPTMVRGLLHGGHGVEHGAAGTDAEKPEVDKYDGGKEYHAPPGSQTDRELSTGGAEPEKIDVRVTETAPNQPEPVAVPGMTENERVLAGSHDLKDELALSHGKLDAAPGGGEKMVDKIIDGLKGKHQLDGVSSGEEQRLHDEMVAKMKLDGLIDDKGAIKDYERFKELDPYDYTHNVTDHMHQAGAEPFADQWQDHAGGAAAATSPIEQVDIGAKTAEAGAYPGVESTATLEDHTQTLKEAGFTQTGEANIFNSRYTALNAEQTNKLLDPNNKYLGESVIGAIKRVTGGDPNKLTFAVDPHNPAHPQLKFVVGNHVVGHELQKSFPDIQQPKGFWSGLWQTMTGHKPENVVDPNVHHDIHQVATAQSAATGAEQHANAAANQPAQPENEKVDFNLSKPAGEPAPDSGQAGTEIHGRAADTVVHAPHETATPTPEHAYPPIVQQEVEKGGTVDGLHDGVYKVIDSNHKEAYFGQTNFESSEFQTAQSHYLSENNLSLDTPGKDFMVDSDIATRLDKWRDYIQNRASAEFFEAKYNGKN